MIDKEMTIEIKDLGIITRFNELDVNQTKTFTKISNATYIQKTINEHPTMFNDYQPSNHPLPANDNKAFIRTMETATPPTSPDEQLKLQVSMQFNYRQAIGELIFAMVTCRPDISFPLIKLSQYAQNPAREHYEAVIKIFHYLNATIERGIYYWRPNDNKYLPLAPSPTPKPQSHIPSHVRQDTPATLTGMVHT